jgi:2-polyprenyl-6-methoxyphenol hydroxylase-like FAD-dependent oxidoreductase
MVNDARPRDMIEFLLLRELIVKHLRAECEAKCAGSVAFADGHALVGGCLSKGQLQFEDCASGSTVSVQADLVVLADGAGSRCRALLQQEVRPTLRGLTMHARCALKCACVTCMTSRRCIGGSVTQVTCPLA